MKKEKQATPTPTPEPVDERAGLPSASGIERMMMCPGSKHAEEGQPEPEDNEASSEGTIIHTARETGDVSELTDEQIQIVDRLTTVEAQALEAWRNYNKIPAQTEVKAVREERMWFREHGTMRPLASAKLDVYYLHANTGLIIDLKTGYLETPPAASNWQLRVQALTLWHEDPLVQFIRVAIAQHRFHTKFDDCDYTENDLKNSEEELHHGLWRAEQPDAPRVPGTWCRYCKAKGNCPEGAAYALLPVVVAGQQPTDSSLKGEGLKAEMVRRVDLLSPQALTFLWERRAIITAILEAAAFRLKAMDGTQLTTLGLSLQENSPSREVENLPKALDLLFKAGLITPEIFQSCCKVSIGKIEEAIKKTTAAKLNITQDQAKNHIATIIAPAVKLNPRSATLVKAKGGAK